MHWCPWSHRPKPFLRVCRAEFLQEPTAAAGSPLTIARPQKWSRTAVSSVRGKILQKKASRSWQEPIRAHMYPNVPMDVAREARSGIVSEDKAEMHPTNDIRAGMESERAKATKMTMIRLHQYPSSALAASRLWRQSALSKCEAASHLSTIVWESVARPSSWSTTLQGSSARSGRLPYQ